MENSSERCLRAQGKQRSAGGRVSPHGVGGGGDARLRQELVEKTRQRRREDPGLLGRKEAETPGQDTCFGGVPWRLCGWVLWYHQGRSTGICGDSEGMSRLTRVSGEIGAAPRGGRSEMPG